MATGRETLKQRIALDGGKEIKEELAALGKAGEEAFRKLEQASKASEFGGSQLGKGLKDLQASFANLGDAGRRFGRDLGGLRNSALTFGSSLAGVATRVAALGAALTAGATAAGAFAISMARSAAEAADAAGNAAKSAGMSVEAFTALQYAAGQSGVGVNEFSSALQQLNKHIGAAHSGDKRASDLFRQLGVSIKDARGQLLPTEEILKRVSQAFRSLPDGAEKSAFAMRLFGNAGARLLPFLSTGRKGLEDLSREARESGLIFTEAQTKMAAAMTGSLSRLRQSVQATRNQLGLLFAPAVTRGADVLIDIINRNRAAIIAFGRTVEGYAHGVVSDLINMFVGRDELVNRSWIITLRDGVSALAAAVQGAFNNIIAPAFRLFMGVLNTFASVVNRVFGTELSGAQVALALTVAKIVGAFALIPPAIALTIASLKLLFSSLALLKGLGAVAASALSVLAPSFAALGAKVGAAFAAAFTGATGLTAIFASAISGSLAAVSAGFAALGTAAGTAFIASFFKLFAVGFAAGALARVIYDSLRGEEVDLSQVLKLDPSTLKPNADALKAQIEALGTTAADTSEKIKTEMSGAMRHTEEQFSGIGKRISLHSATDNIKGELDGLGQKTVEVSGIISNIPIEEFYRRAAEQAARTKGAVDQLGPAAEAAKDAWSFDGVWESIATAADIMWKGIVTGAEQSWARIPEIFSADNFAQIWADIGNGSQAAWDAIAASASGLWDGIKSEAQAAWAPVIDGFQSAWSSMVDALRGLWSGFSSFVTSSVQSLASSVEAVVSRVMSAVESLRAAIAAAASEAAALASSGIGGGGDAEGFATGGPVVGRGTSTSDSILAWLSNGEYVIQARAVAKYGRALLDAINSGNFKLPGYRSGGPVRAPSLKFNLPAFNLGGLADMLAMPSFAPAIADQQQQPALAPVTLNIGGETISGLLAPADVVGKLHSFASRAQLASAGRAPRWVGG